MPDNNKTKNLPHIVILGAGSIGCYVGGCLTHSHANITFIGRVRLQKQINEHGMLLTDWQGRKHHLNSEQISFSTSEQTLAQADIILVTVKSGDTENAAKAIAAHANTNALIISFQNGISNADVLKQYLPNTTVLKGMVPFNVFNKGNGHFHCGTEGNLAIEDSQKLADDLVNLLSEASLPVDVYDDLTGIQWSKLIMNLNNAVNALSGVPLVNQLDDKLYRKTMAKVIKEALGVLKAANITLVRNGKVIPALLPYILTLPTWLFKRVASAMLKIDPDARSSMYEDLTLRRKTEIDYLNGAIVTLAIKLGKKAPINSGIVKLIKQAEENNAGSPLLTAKEMFSIINK